MTLPSRPVWLPEQIYNNIVGDDATPEANRGEVISLVCACIDLSSAQHSFNQYFDSIDIPAKSATLCADELLGHLYFSYGFFKRVVEMIGAGDEAAVEADFQILKDPSRPRRERRKVVERLRRAMVGKPIRTGVIIWLYRQPDDRALPTPGEILLKVDPCMPWRLGLPFVTSGSEYV